MQNFGVIKKLRKKQNFWSKKIGVKTKKMM